MVLYPLGATNACHICAGLLRSPSILTVDHPTPEVTHLLLDVPAFTENGILRSGEDITSILRMLPPNVTVIGGALNHPALADYRIWDLLTREDYLARNAAITADCAVRLAGSKMDFVFSRTPALVIGWGRIGKCLARMLQQLGCSVTVAARKISDRAMAEALGFHAVEIQDVPKQLSRFPLLFNTVPAPVVSVPVPKSSIALELASRNGICGESVLIARGLPGKYAPDSAGTLMADVISKWIKEETP